MFFFCGFVPIWWTSFYIMRVVTIIVESRLFPFKQVLYYIIGVRVRPPCTTQAVFLLLPGTNLEWQQLCEYTNTHYFALSSCFCQAPTWSGNDSLHMPSFWLFALIASLNEGSLCGLHLITRPVVSVCIHIHSTAWSCCTVTMTNGPAHCDCTAIGILACLLDNYIQSLVPSC